MIGEAGNSEREAMEMVRMWCEWELSQGWVEGRGIDYHSRVSWYDYSRKEDAYGKGGSKELGWLRDDLYYRRKELVSRIYPEKSEAEVERYVQERWYSIMELNDAECRYDHTPGDWR